MSADTLRASPSHRQTQYDIAFIGAGISTASALRSLLATLASGPSAFTTRIAVIDPDNSHFGGTAYGERSGPTARIITCLAEFLPPEERTCFVGWLRQHASEVLAEPVQSGGDHTSKWVRDHGEQIAAGDCDSLYLPRRLYGRYLEDTLRAAIESARASGRATIDHVHVSARSVRQTTCGYQIDLADSDALDSGQVVLAVGPPARRRLFPAGGPDGTLVVEDPYDPGLPEAVQQVADHLTQIDDHTPRIAIVGANATMLDLLYQFEDHPGIAASEPVYCVVSPRGVLPPRAGQVNGRMPTLPNLDALEQQPEVSAQDVLRAVLDDLSHHGAPTEEVAWLIPSVNDAIGRIIQQLDDDEKAVFANSVGTEIGRFQRRAGDDYSQVVDDLDAEGRIERVRGTFDELMALRTSDRVDVVINATGSAGLATGTAPLLDSIIEGGLATPTPSNAGFAVDDSCAASPGLFVMGPLLAGNVIDGRPIWHLEHAGRIIEMGTALGRRLGQNLL